MVDKVINMKVDHKIKINNTH